MHERAGTTATTEDLTDITALVAAYFDKVPDPREPAQAVSFGTSGHRGSSFASSFNELHIAAITQATCEYRAEQGITGPLLIGFDTHGLSQPAFRTALSVAIGNEATVWIDGDWKPTPTPAVSHAVLRLNGHGTDPSAKVDGGVDALIITPSHNPPSDGGIKYNPPHGGPAGADITDVIQRRANELMETQFKHINRVNENEGLSSAQAYDFTGEYVRDLTEVIDIEAIKNAGVRIGVDPLGGAAVEYWKAIKEHFGLDITLTNDAVDPQWAFMPLDHDGKIRMDCSSKFAMANLLQHKDEFDVCCGNDADSDRHGIVTPDGGLMNPNHFLAVAIDYLLAHREGWPTDAAVGKTLVSSAIIDKVVASKNRTLSEVPVGFKWFVDGLFDGSFVFGGEESAGASFLRTNGRVWSTDKDGLILCLLAAEIIAVTGKTPSQRYAELEEEFGQAAYARQDAPATREQKQILKSLTKDDVQTSEIAGEAITAVMSHAPGNGAAIGGIKVTTEHAWFAARPSGTEDLYKIYAESLKGEDHLAEVHKAARVIVDDAFTKGSSEA